MPMITCRLVCLSFPRRQSGIAELSMNYYLGYQTKKRMSLVDTACGAGISFLLVEVPKRLANLLLSEKMRTDLSVERAQFGFE